MASTDIAPKMKGSKCLWIQPRSVALRIACARSKAPSLPYGLQHLLVRLRGSAVVRLRGKPLDGSLHALDRPVLAQHGEGLEDPWRDRAAGDRDPDRLVELSRLDVLLGEDPAQGALQLRRVE